MNCNLDVNFMGTANIFFTVFTPTFNRAIVLHRVYESLLQQTFNNFEWLIIDDGSTDNTAELVSRWSHNQSTWFSIRYYRQENQHKKVAHNFAVEHARGELFICLDSDDKCIPEALEKLYFHWHQIPASERHQFSSIYTLCCDEFGCPIGDYFPCESWIDSTTLDIAYKFKIRGEKWGVYRTSILRKFPFPEEATKLPGLVMESVVWNKISENYRTRFLNDHLRIYFSNCLDPNIVSISSISQIKLNSPGMLFSHLHFLNQYFSYCLSDPITFIKSGALITRFYFHCDSRLDNNYLPDGIFPKILVIILFPLGFTLYLRDLLRQKFGDS